MDDKIKKFTSNKSFKKRKWSFDGKKIVQKFESNFESQEKNKPGNDNSEFKNYDKNEKRSRITNDLLRNVTCFCVCKIQTDESKTIFPVFLF